MIVFMYFFEKMGTLRALINAKKTKEEVRFCLFYVHSYYIVVYFLAGSNGCSGPASCGTGCDH